MLGLHKKWCLGICVVVYGQLLINALLTTNKTWNELDWLDILGEGGTALLILLWLYFILAARPGGRVTNLMGAGLLAFFVGVFQDALDEIFHMGASTPWHSVVESVASPLGMILMTVGLYFWRQEQGVVNRQLKKREKLFRQHQLVDTVTQITELNYFKYHLRIALSAKHVKRKFTLLLLDINQFNRVNQRFGNAEGDRILHAISELIMLNLRDDDLLSRYAGDRYAILLANTIEAEANVIGQELIAAIEHFAFKTLQGERVRLAASVGLACAREDSVDSILMRAKQALALAKQQTNSSALGQLVAV
ncbi:Inner membrane protein YeaI [Thalassocella blandensis]|nr:Inner membrane protein YeaI [Thalassocella blandensis]